LSVKPIIWSGHALERMLERGFTRSEVEVTIRAPDLKENAQRGRLRAKKRFGHRELNVFYRETNRVIIFVTAYWRKL